MARKPKTDTSTVATTPADDLPGLDDSPAPPRRGRKPKAAEPLATMDSNDMPASTFDADSTAVEAEPPRERKRPGPKPKQAGAPSAAASKKGSKAKPGRKARAESTPDLEAFDNEPDAEMPVQMEEALGLVSGAPEATMDMTASDAPPVTASQDPTPSAAQWDRATDTVHFEWDAIERTASQEGPNQAMAKLLVAARAEGANSRWPL